MDLDYVTMISRLLHLLAVILAIGGAAFMFFVLGPAAGTVLDDDTHARLRSAVRQRWKRFVHTCIAVILLSGLISVYGTMQGKPGIYMVLFVVKFGAALAVFFVASALVGSSPAFEAMRQQSRKWLGIIVMLAVVIAAVAGVMGALPVEAGQP